MRRLPMRKISEVLRMKASGLSTRKIAASLSIGQPTVVEYLKRAERVGLSWPLPEGTTEADLERRLFAPTGASGGAVWRSRTGRRSTANCGARMSRSLCCGRSIAPHILMTAMGIAGSANSTAAGRAGCRR